MRISIAGWPVHRCPRGLHEPENLLRALFVCARCVWVYLWALCARVCARVCLCVRVSACVCMCRFGRLRQHANLWPRPARP